MSFFKSKIVSITCLILISCQLILPSSTVLAQTFMTLPRVGTMLAATPAFTPALIRGMSIHPEDPFRFDFMVDPGDEALEGELLNQEAQKLMRYFLAALTVPEKEMWVNLSPYEENRIIPPTFRQTEMGRDLLAQDYILKQLTASLMYPENELGKTFWARVRARAKREYARHFEEQNGEVSPNLSDKFGGASDFYLNTFNKIWIVPETAHVYVHEQNVFVAQAHLKVMLEEDYVALARHEGLKKRDGNRPSEAITGMTSDVVRDILIPEIEREVNEGELFASLRQIYHSMILATWYKQNLKESLLSKVYVDQEKIKGVDIADANAHQKIYDQYLAAFKVGVYDYIKEEIDEETQEMIPRKYFAGGVAFDKAHITEVLSVSDRAMGEGMLRFETRMDAATVGDVAKLERVPVEPEENQVSHLPVQVSSEEALWKGNVNIRVEKILVNWKENNPGESYNGSTAQLVWDEIVSLLPKEYTWDNLSLFPRDGVTEESRRIQLLHQLWQEAGLPGSLAAQRWIEIHREEIEKAQRNRSSSSIHGKMLALSDRLLRGLVDQIFFDEIYMEGDQEVYPHTLDWRQLEKVDELYYIQSEFDRLWPYPESFTAQTAMYRSEVSNGSVIYRKIVRMIELFMGQVSVEEQVVMATTMIVWHINHLKRFGIHFEEDAVKGEFLDFRGIIPFARKLIQIVLEQPQLLSQRFVSVNQLGSFAEDFSEEDKQANQVFLDMTVGQIAWFGLEVALNVLAVHPSFNYSVSDSNGDSSIGVLTHRYLNGVVNSAGDTYLSKPSLFMKEYLRNILNMPEYSLEAVEQALLRLSAYYMTSRNGLRNPTTVYVFENPNGGSFKNVKYSVEKHVLAYTYPGLLVLVDPDQSPKFSEGMERYLRNNTYGADTTPQGEMVRMIEEGVPYRYTIGGLRAIGFEQLANFFAHKQELWRVSFLPGDSAMTDVPHQRDRSQTALIGSPVTYGLLLKSQKEKEKEKNVVKPFSAALGIRFDAEPEMIGMEFLQSSTRIDAKLQLYRDIERAYKAFQQGEDFVLKGTIYVDNAEQKAGSSDAWAWAVHEIMHYRVPDGLNLMRQLMLYPEVILFLKMLGFSDDRLKLAEALNEVAFDPQQWEGLLKDYQSANSIEGYDQTEEEHTRNVIKLITALGDVGGILVGTYVDKPLNLPLMEQDWYQELALKAVELFSGENGVLLQPPTREALLERFQRDGDAAMVGRAESYPDTISYGDLVEIRLILTQIWINNNLEYRTEIDPDRMLLYLAAVPFLDLHRIDIMVYETFHKQKLPAYYETKVEQQGINEYFLEAVREYVKIEEETKEGPAVKDVLDRLAYFEIDVKFLPKDRNVSLEENSTFMNVVQAYKELRQRYKQNGNTREEGVNHLVIKYRFEARFVEEDDRKNFLLEKTVATSSSPATTPNPQANKPLESSGVSTLNADSRKGFSLTPLVQPVIAFGVAGFLLWLGLEYNATSVDVSEDSLLPQQSDEADPKADIRAWGSTFENMGDNRSAKMAMITILIKWTSDPDKDAEQAEKARKILQQENIRKWLRDELQNGAEEQDTLNQALRIGEGGLTDAAMTEGVSIRSLLDEYMTTDAQDISALSGILKQMQDLLTQEEESGISESEGDALLKILLASNGPFTWDISGYAAAALLQVFGTAPWTTIDQKRKIYNTLNHHPLSVSEELAGKLEEAREQVRESLAREVGRSAKSFPVTSSYTWSGMDARFRIDVFGRTEPDALVDVTFYSAPWEISGISGAHKRFEGFLIRQKVDAVKKQLDAALRRGEDPFIQQFEKEMSDLFFHYVSDPAMLESDDKKRLAQRISDQKGGIDLDSAHLDMQTEGDVIKMNFPLEAPAFDPAMLEGLVPVILNVAPITNMPFLLGLTDDPQESLPEKSVDLVSRDPASMI